MLGFVGVELTFFVLQLGETPLQLAKKQEVKKKLSAIVTARHGRSCGAVAT